MRAEIIGARTGRLMAFLLPRIDACRKMGVSVVLLVPEQYTLQAERELISGLKLPGLMDVEVLSPRRLTRRIRENGGSSGLTPIDESGRHMALAHAMAACKENLAYYQRVAQTVTLPQKISALIADLQRAGLTPEALQTHADSLPQGALRAKERDVALIWQTYLELVAGRFADETMQQQETAERLVPSGVLNGAALFVYGFDVLPRPLCALLCEAASTLHSLTVTMTMDNKDAPDGRIFLTQRTSANQLMGMLRERGVEVAWRYLPPEEDADRAPALCHLEKYLFTRRCVPFEGSVELQQCVSLHAAATPFAEASHIARTLQTWQDAGIPWDRMAVAMADANSMAGILAVTLTSAGIPHYIARKDAATRHGLARMLLGALRAATGGYATVDVLTCAKSGFSPLTAAEAHQLENYALSNGIDHRRWCMSFARGDFEAAEPLRQRLMSPILTLQEGLREDKTATQSATAIFRLLEDVQAYERLQQREEELLQRGMGAEAAQNRQVWQVVMNLLDQLHALLGERRAAMKDVARFVSSGLTGASIAALPPRKDAVLIGEAGHLLTGQIDALILCGMQDGVLGSVQNSLITETERRVLSDGVHRPIGLTRVETAALRQSDFYRTIALPARRLMLTFSQGAQDGTALRPSSLIEDVRGLLPEVTVTGGVTADGSRDVPLSPQTALNGLAPRLRALADGREEQLAPAWAEALRWLWRNPDWHDRTKQVIAGAVGKVPDGKLPEALTRRLLMQDALSISRLEKFAGCPYQHYVDYGLRPVKREPWAFEAADAGDFYHAALQGFAHAALLDPNWPNLEEEDVNRLMEDVLAPLTEAWRDGPLADSPSQRLQGEKYIATAKRAAWLFTRHAQSSRFATVGEEVAFGEEGGLPPVVLTLSDGRQIALRGKIDRIDAWEGDAGKYLRIIDYKSSRREIDPTRLWYGLQLQLLLYLQAASQGLKGKAAGAFYFTVKDPLVDAQDAKEAAEKAIAKQLQLKGVVLSDVAVVSAMDADGTQLGSIFTQKGTLSERAPAYSREEMDALLRHTKQQAEHLAEGLLAGDISVSPAEVDKWTPCQYCEYRAICGFDPALPHCAARSLPDMKRKDLLEKLSEGEKEG